MKFTITRDLSGVSFQGYLIARYSSLVEVFGVPDLMPTSNGTTTTSWALRFEDGTIATIYDYKSTSVYGFGLPSPEEFRQIAEQGVGYEWHVGGYEVRAMDLVHATFKE